MIQRKRNKRLRAPIRSPREHALAQDARRRGAAAARRASAGAAGDGGEAGAALAAELPVDGSWVGGTLDAAFGPAQSIREIGETLVLTLPARELAVYRLGL